VSRTALGHLSVLDLSEIISGQYCSRLLADFGADVLLIEPPGGSVTRRTGPFRADGRSQLFLHLNLGKRALTLDPATAAGRDRLAGLVATADIVLVPPGLDRAALAARNPRAVIALCSDFGEDGPRARWQGSEMIHQALAGTMFRNGRPDREPLYGVGHRAYYAAGVATYIAVLAAIHARGRTGRGQEVAVDVCETAASMTYAPANQYFYNGTVEPRSVPQKLPSAVVRCRDAWVSIFIYAHHWRATWAALGRPEVADDPRFVSVEARMDHWPEVVALLRAAVADRAADEVVEAVQAAGAVCGKSATPRELAASTHLAERGYWQSVEDEGGRRRILGPPFRLSATPWSVRGEAPDPAPAALAPEGAEP
jgi:crotonobetainyl-CoA:carnitine CoA-transferase CaiB-like acyl-CoA transferase